MSSSARPTASDPGGPPSPREMNEQMVHRLLAQQPEPIAAGGYGLRVLQSTGRVSGAAHCTPVGVLRRANSSYLVCPDRTRDWPRNLLAHPRCAIRAGDGQDHRSARPVDGQEGIAAVATYLSVVQTPWALRAFGLSDDPSPEEIAQAMPRMIVFRLDAPDLMSPEREH